MNIPPAAVFEESAYVAKVVSDVLRIAFERAVPGTTTLELAEVCDHEIRDRGLQPAMKGLNEYPEAACVSINREVLHGVPSDRKIERGDLVTIQTAAKGQYAFANQGWTYAIGPTRARRAAFRDAVMEVLSDVVQLIRPDMRIGDLGSAIIRDM